MFYRKFKYDKFIWLNNKDKYNNIEQINQCIYGKIGGIKWGNIL